MLRKIVLLSATLIFIGLGGVSFSTVSFAESEPVDTTSVEGRNIPIIEDIKLANFDSTKMYAGSTKGLELSVMTSVNYLDGSDTWTLTKMLKTKYPEVNETNVDGYSFSAKDSLNFINTETAHTARWSSNLLTEDVIRTSIKDNKPIIVYLTANKPENYWIESITAVVIYGYTYLNFGPGQIIFDIHAYSPNHTAPLLNLNYMNDINLIGGMEPATTFKYGGSIIFN